MNTAFIRKYFGINDFNALDALILSTWGVSIVLYYFRTFLSKIIGISSVNNPIITIIIVSCIVLSIKRLLRIVRFKDILFVCLLIIYYYACYILYPHNTSNLDGISEQFLLLALPLYFIGLSTDISRHKIMLISLAKISLITDFIIMFLMGGINEYGLSGSEADGMSQAYALLPFCLLLLWNYFENGNKWDLAYAIFSIVMILAFGTRGPVFCILAFIILYLLLFREYKRPLLSRFIIVVVGFLFYYFLKEFMAALNLFLLSMGMSTRITASFLEENLLDSNGRDEIAEIVMEGINRAPFWGNGIAGDRFLRGEGYAHRIDLEMMATFGKIPGICIMILLSCLLLSTFRRCVTKDQALFLLLLVCCCMQLLFSSSFVICPFFFMTIGYAVAINRNQVVN